ncbi:polyprenyl glycosylphosphotransferase [Microbacterium mangrovi]|uniref:Polyprenyl glycosylphosphotransferase n=1 Tax=Microbacterium mangrovi TaxID=1348253 RepID=A0A0B2AE17_9MICO|nr:polyprenyl glycosylphosphotransferase [Microbacterium mangrovi]
MTRTAGPVAAETWKTRLARRMWVTDLLVLATVVFGTQLIWFGAGLDTVVTRTPLVTPIPYWVFSLVLIALWMWTLALADTRVPGVIGSGNAEYSRVLDASLRLFGALAIVAFLVKFDIGRGYLLLSLPAGILLLEASRWAWRVWLSGKRKHGAYFERAILIGTASSVRDLADELDRVPGAGYEVVGACLPTAISPRAGVPYLGPIDDLASAVARTSADTVIVAGTEGLGPSKVKEISWALENGPQQLVLAPGILDVAGPRIHPRPVSGLPLIHVEAPNLSKGQCAAKRAFDIVGSAVLIALLSPLLLVIGLVVRVSGPAFFRQTRVGKNGRRFRMIKFRSMVVDAEARLAEVKGTNDTNEVLFKRRDDPRVTPLGRWMRRHSIDELPQLFNVLGGSMSLVGPRPSLPDELAKYDDHVHRRFLAKPGMTGLWQVSGRSTLSWEESVRLDLSYVENWSLPGDMVILGRTVREVVAPGERAA